MAWLPLDFGDGTIDVEVASDLASDAPAYARGFIGLAYRIDAQGRFENIYLRPTNSTAPDQVRRNHTIQYAAYPDFRFDMCGRSFPRNMKATPISRRGVGIWIESGTVAHFRNLRVKPGK
jgi:hypothetical protein